MRTWTKTWMSVVAILLVACLTVATAEAKAAKTKTKTRKEKAVSGTIVSIAGDGGSFVLQNKGKKGTTGTQRTLTINASTTIAINGTSGKKAADLSAGMTAKVELTGDAASHITVEKTKTKAKKKKS